VRLSVRNAESAIKSLVSRWITESLVKNYKLLIVRLVARKLQQNVVIGIL
jgi:hypothetical protein